MSDVSTDLRHGEMVTLTGVSGAGKSTLIPRPVHRLAQLGRVRLLQRPRAEFTNGCVCMREMTETAQTAIRATAHAVFSAFLCNDGVVEYLPLVDRAADPPLPERLARP